MASISKDKNGNRRIQFVCADGRRPAIRLGKVSQRTAEGIKYRVEQLLEAINFNRPLDNDLTEWVKGLNPEMSKKLAAVGLIPDPDAKPTVTLGDQLDAYFAKRVDVKTSTATHWNHTKRLLLKFFGADRSLASITAGDAKDWERWLRTAAARMHRYGESKDSDGLAVNTARKRVSNAKQFFEDAVSREVLARNPFAGLKGAVGSNRERDYFLTRENAAKIVDACPDLEWRLIFCLCRFGGLRCPSEVLALRWSDINWERGIMVVRSAKTEHHEGKGQRIVPLFPELRQHLDEGWDRLKTGVDRVITRYGDARQNLRTTFAKIVTRAGLKPWPKLFQNLRASRATELANEYSPHVAAAWLGHSTAIANKHYWQVTDADIQKAIASVKPDANQAAQKAAQQALAMIGKELQTVDNEVKQTAIFPCIANRCDHLQYQLMGDEGLEPPTSCL